jgi:hypothetical protein
MSSGNVGFMNKAPIQERVIAQDGTLTDIWKKYFDSVSQTLGLVIVHDRFNINSIVPGVNPGQEVPVTNVISMTTVQRQALENAITGDVIYDTDLNAFVFRQGGSWVIFTPTVVP